MSKLITIANLVKDILIDVPETRNSDYFLYLNVLERTAKQNGTPEPKDLTVSYFLTNAKRLKFPYFETVRRARQKIQEDFPELKSVPAVAKVKAAKEEVFKQFARGELE